MCAEKFWKSWLQHFVWRVSKNSVWRLSEPMSWPVRSSLTNYYSGGHTVLGLAVQKAKEKFPLANDLITHLIIDSLQMYFYLPIILHQICFRWKYLSNLVRKWKKKRLKLLFVWAWAQIVVYPIHNSSYFVGEGKSNYPSCVLKGDGINWNITLACSGVLLLNLIRFFHQEHDE